MLQIQAIQKYENQGTPIYDYFFLRQNYRVFEIYSTIEDAIKNLPYDIKDIDLIVSASYSPYDTVATIAHLAQRKYDIPNMRALYASAACSSFVNGLEIVEGYFASGKAKKALLVCSEHNTYYSNESDPKCGHLWGDAAVAFFL